VVSESLRGHRILEQPVFKCVTADCALRSLKNGEYQTLRNRIFVKSFFELEKQAYMTV
jgi:hypothetical protein